MTLIMGVLNVTPDSFSDGGRWFDHDAAIEHGLALAAEGAHIVDVGGESTRPGASRVPIDEEIARVVPVIAALTARGITVSVDTMNAATAWAAAEAGASIINDVSGGLADPAMTDAAVNSGLEYVVMHWRGHSATMNSLASYADVAGEVHDELFARVAALEAAGAAPERLIVDPGLGFSKNAGHNWQVLGHLRAFEDRGIRVLIGASRKRFLGALLPEDAPVEARDLPTAVISALAARAGVWAVRVHDVPSTRVALAVEEAWRAGANAGASGDATLTGAPGRASAPAATLCSSSQSGGLPAHKVAADGSASGPVAAVGEDRDMTDCITLTGLRVHAHHGVFDFERRDGQEFVIDVVARLDLAAAATGDDLTATVHYGELAEAVVEAARHDPVDLIETLAERVAAVVLGYAAVASTRVTVHKPNAPIEVPFGDVAVTIERGRVVAPAPAHVASADGADTPDGSAP